MYAELQEKCGSLYEPNQRFFNDKCASVESDSFFQRLNYISEDTMKCNIPGVNTTSIIDMYIYTSDYLKDKNNACPIGGWCEYENNLIKYDTNGITTQFLLTKSDGTTEPLCPPNISSDGSSTSTQCGGGFNYNYAVDCESVNQYDMMMGIRYCKKDENNSIIWEKDDNNNEYCEIIGADPVYSKLYRDIDNTLTCNNGDPVPNVTNTPVYKIAAINDSGVEKIIYCPQGDCAIQDGDLNYEYIQSRITDVDKHPLCSKP